MAYEVGPSGSWQGIVDIAFAPDGRIFVAEKRGRVWIVRGNLKLAEPFLEIDQEVLENGDRGLLSITLDPNFSSNARVYLYYTVDPDLDGIDDDGPTFSRVTRYTASESNPDVADPSSRQVLIGASWSDGIPAIYNTHTVGTLRFGTDGTLLISSGESAHVDTPDPGGRDPSAFGSGKFSSAEDIGAFRSQWIESLAGKILRIDPVTGLGLSSNPYYTGDPQAKASRVYAYGLRNPFRMTIRPGTGSSNPADGNPGTIYVGDVGWTTWEEVSVVRGGENLGWPCREGFAAAPNYPSITPAHHGCNTIGTSQNPGPLTAPLVDWNHTTAGSSHPPGFAGKCTAGVAFYSGNEYPTQYRGALFMADYDGRWIRVARVTSTDGLIEILPFATDAGGPVDLQADPVSGDIFYVALDRNEIRRIRFDPTNLPPTAEAAGAPTEGESPLAVQFSSSGSSDPNSDPLTYHWDFGDGSTSAEPDPLHTYTIAGSHTATLTVDDGRGAQGSDLVSITVTGGQPGNQTPTVSIITPVEAAHYASLAKVQLKGSATDEDPQSSLQFRWELILHHNTHIHPGFLYLDGPEASFVPEDHDDGTGTFLEIALRVTDTDGATGVRRAYIYPPREPIIIDNGQTGTVRTGSWPISGSSFPYGETSLYSKSVGATYDYNFIPKTAGLHQIHAWWTYASTRVTAVPYEITRVGGTTTVLVNQRDRTAEDHWNYLGTFDLGTSGRVRIRSTSSSSSTSADAVQVFPVKADQTIIDDGDPRASRVGTWTSSTGTGFFGTKSVYSKTLGHTFTWNPVPPASGVHDVYAWWTQLASRTTAAPYAVTYENGSQTVNVNQKTNGGKWNLLGTYRFDKTGRVVLSAVGGTSTTSADAVRLVFRPLDRIIDDGEPGTSSTGSWSVSTTTGFYGARSVFAKGTDSTYAWEVPIRAPGSYEVMAWWTASANRTTAAPYEVFHDAGTTAVTRDQKVNGWRWNSLGTYSFTNKAVIRLGANSEDVSFSADAIRLRKT